MVLLAGAKGLVKTGSPPSLAGFICFLASWVLQLVSIGLTFWLYPDGFGEIGDAVPAPLVVVLIPRILSLVVWLWGFGLALAGWIVKIARRRPSDRLAWINLLLIASGYVLLLIDSGFWLWN